MTLQTGAFRLGAIVVLAGLGAFPVAAQQRKAAEPKQKAATAGPQQFLLGETGDWKAVVTGKDKAKVCYAMSTPKSRKPDSLNRDPGFVFISNRADGAKNELAIKLGFAGKPNEDGQLKIGTATFLLKPAGNDAFLKNPAQEPQVIAAMKKASGLTIAVKSLRGNLSTDTYSLNGFGAAVERMAKECP